MITQRRHLLTQAIDQPKAIKGKGHNWLTAFLHLAPSDLSGHNVCPMARRLQHKSDIPPAHRLSQCSSTCLNLAGNARLAAGGFVTNKTVVDGSKTNSIQTARIARTQWLFSDRQGFVKRLAHEMTLHANKARRQGFLPAFRLNATSDLDWYNIFASTGHDLNALRISLNARLYDYTKVAKRALNPHPGYHLTYSLSEIPDSQQIALQVLARGGNVAVVFRNHLPSHFLGFPVVNGDETDLRFLDPPATVVGLKAKGYAKHDASGFVQDTGSQQERIAL